MSQDVKLKAEKRESTGKRAVENLRKVGQVPAVMQEKGKESVHLCVQAGEIWKAYEEAGRSQPIDLTVDGTKKLALIKQIEFMPLKPEVQHVVFQVLKQNQAVDAEVPIEITGEIPAEANRHVLLRTLDSVEVRALPKNLPEALEVSGESLVEVDDRLTVRDITLPEGVELVETLTNVEDEEKQEEFLDQPIVLVKDASVVESDEGTEVEEGESEADKVESENGGDTPQGEADAFQASGNKDKKE